MSPKSWIPNIKYLKEFGWIFKERIKEAMKFKWSDRNVTGNHRTRDIRDTWCEGWSVMVSSASVVQATQQVLLGYNSPKEHLGPIPFTRSNFLHSWWELRKKRQAKEEEEKETEEEGRVHDVMAPTSNVEGVAQSRSLRMQERARGKTTSLGYLICIRRVVNTPQN